MGGWVGGWVGGELGVMSFPITCLVRHRHSIHRRLSLSCLHDSLIDSSNFVSLLLLLLKKGTWTCCAARSVPTSSTSHRHDVTHTLQRLAQIQGGLGHSTRGYPNPTAAETTAAAESSPSTAASRAAEGEEDAFFSPSSSSSSSASSAMVTAQTAQTAQPLWQRADIRFFWNRDVVSDLISAGAHAWVSE